MPGSLALMSPLPSSSTAAALAHEADLRSQIVTLRDSNAPEPRLRLVRLFSAKTGLGRGASPAVRALQTAVQLKLAAYIGDEHGLYDVALSALDSFVNIRIKDARSKASESFAQLCHERDWTSLALFSASSVAEEALRTILGTKNRLTVIDVAPGYEGRATAKRLASATGASIRYGLLSNCQRLLDGVHVCVIGAEEVTMNGCILAAPGAGMVAQVAKEIGIPVVVTTQAVKFSEGMVVDWTYAGYDVLRPDEVLAIVTELEMESGVTGIGPWAAPDVLDALARTRV